MNRKRSSVRCLALGLTAGLLVGFVAIASPASAEEPVAETATSTEQVVEAPAVEEASAPDPVVPAPVEKPAPVADEGVAPAPQPVAETKPKTTTHPDKPWICHPVNGKGETGEGWNLINPSHYSSHIDDQGDPKHESQDGRVDTPAVNGACPKVESKYPYEVTVCWTMADDGNPATEFDWPQTRGCDLPAPTCEDQKLQFQTDTYWIRDKADEDYLASLTGLNSPADDAQLEPHNYFSSTKTVEAKDESECVEAPVLGHEERTSDGPVDCENFTITVTTEERNEILGEFNYETHKWDVSWSDWTFKSSADREATGEEVTAQCVPPTPRVVETSSSKYECGDDFISVHHVFTSFPKHFDEVVRDWVEGEGVVTTSDTKEATDVVACPKTGKPDEPKDTTTTNLNQVLPDTGGQNIALLGLGFILVMAAGLVLYFNKKSRTE